MQQQRAAAPGRGVHRVRCQARSVHKAAPKQSRQAGKPADAPPLDVSRLLTDAKYAAQRWVGPVDLAQLPGKGRGVVTKRVVAPGELLFSSLPVRGAHHGQLGANLRPEELQQRLLPVEGLSELELHQLNQLYDGSSGGGRAGAGSMEQLARAPKAAAASKGFGAARQQADVGVPPAAGRGCRWLQGLHRAAGCRRPPTRLLPAPPAPTSARSLHRRSAG
jgi:hypothetical protein